MKRWVFQRLCTVPFRKIRCHLVPWSNHQFICCGDKNEDKTSHWKELVQCEVPWNPSKNHWAVLNRNNQTCQKHKVWAKDKYAQCEWDTGHLSSHPHGPHPRRWRDLSAHVPGVRGTASHIFRFHISWGEFCEQWMKRCYSLKRKYLLSLPNERWLSKLYFAWHTMQLKIQIIFEQSSQSLGNHRTGMCHTCWGVRSFRKMIYHEVWDLSQLQTAELWFR